ncbi:MAG: cobalamin synthesis protein P47K [Bacteroidaceae bacterium]|nr:cobalamin synthesis protein P47K [Bacteroidaceae bacterium]
MNQTRLILCGGFLGAGKTTLIWDVAQRLMAQGKRVGLITNDQAPELVDSRLLKQANLKVSEVAGSCFCCNFNGFVDAVRSLRSDVEADVILAEPVGSCADLTATIVRPLKKYHNTEVIVSPLTVLSDPMRLKSILYGGDGGLHEDAAYIYRKQLEESEVILITKTDLLSEDEVEKLVKDTQACFHHTKVMTASTMTGQGMKEWFKEVANRQGEGTKILDIDYDKYAHGEAVLGWLNGTVALSGKNVYWDTLLKDIMTGICRAIKKEHLRVGHVKVIAENGKQYAVGNITGDVSTLQLRGTAGMSDNVKLIINARVETTPEHLDELIREVLVEAIDGQYKDEVLAWRYLQPGRPNPTHRLV